MPYAKNSELPANVKKMAPNQQNAYRKAYNSANENDDNDESACHAIAMAAAKKAKTSDASSTTRVFDTTRVSMSDRLEMDEAAKVTMLTGGYLKAMPRIARTGIQIYGGDEMGMPEVDTIRVYRPETAVFDAKTVKSYTHIPVTLDHPPVPVNSSNWKEYAIGETGDEVLRDGGTVRVPLMMRDSAAIAAMKDGKNQLSVGYDCDITWEPGLTPDGQPYDAVQSNIEANHLAVVVAARGGSQLRIGDATREQPTGDTAMNLKTIVIDGFEVQLLDTSASIIQRVFKDMEKKIEDADEDVEKAKKKAKTAEDALVAANDAVKAKDAEIVTLKSQVESAKLTPQQIDALVRDRAEVGAKAVAILGASYKADGKSVEDVRREVVSAKLGDAAKGWDDKQVTASFNTLTAGIKLDANGGGNGGGHGGYNGNDFSAFSHAFDSSRPGGPGYGDPREAAHADYTKSLGDAWKTKPAA